jgi:dTMP kinase
MSLEDEIEAFRNDRIGHVRDLVRPALDDGKVVILDRYFYSFLAYQGSRGADLDALREMTRSAPVPHAAFLLDIDPRRSLERIAASRSAGANAFETVSALDRAREFFLVIFRDTPTGLVIDASSAIGEIERQIAVRLLHGVLRGRPSATTESLRRFRRSSPTPTSM